MEQPDNEVVGVIKPAPEPHPSTEEEKVEAVERAKEQIKDFDFWKYKKDKEQIQKVDLAAIMAHRRAIGKYNFYEPPVRRDKPIEIIRPEAIYTQSASPYGIADELHRRKLK